MSVVWLNKPHQRANAQADDVPAGTEAEDLAFKPGHGAQMLRYI